MENQIIEAYKMVVQKDDQPDLEAVWGCCLGIMGIEKDFSKNHVRKFLDEEGFIYYYKGELQNSPLQNVW